MQAEAFARKKSRKPAVKPTATITRFAKDASLTIREDGQGGFTVPGTAMQGSLTECLAYVKKQPNVTGVICETK